MSKSLSSNENKCGRLHIKTPFTFWDMPTGFMWKVCLHTYRNNKIC